MVKTLIIVALSVFLVACAGSNPNIGETTTDRAWNTGNFTKAYNTAKPYADQGHPWAQLRLGIFYENGWGVDKDEQQAAGWYSKAANQMADGEWAEGKIVGATGEAGYFNQNSDALIAKYNLAQMYFYGNGVTRDLNQALALVDEVISKSKGESVFFCCEFAEPRYFTHEQFSTLRKQVIAELQ